VSSWFPSWRRINYIISTSRKSSVVATLVAFYPND
jgi:hypothetical protein